MQKLILFISSNDQTKVWLSKMTFTSSLKTEKSHRVVMVEYLYYVEFIFLNRIIYNNYNNYIQTKMK